MHAVGNFDTQGQALSSEECGFEVQLGPTMIGRSMVRQAAGCSSAISGEAAGLTAGLPPLGAATAVAAAAFRLLGTDTCFPPGESGDKLGRERCRLLSDGCTGSAAAGAGGTCPAARVPAP
jgi:hypothetical protein